MMKELKLEDYEKIKKYLDLANYEGYNSNFVTMMMWNHEYHIQYEIHEHFMIMLHHYKDIQFWAMPFTTPEYYQEAIDYMIEYSHKNNFEFVIDCAIEEFVNHIKPIYKDKLLYERTPDNDDYIYDRQMLQTLSGKKMQKRRNHYNAFVKEHPDFIYRDLDITNDFETILNCLNKWESEKAGLSESMTSEVRGIMYLLSSKHLLDFEVGGIFINGQMEAFIIASRLKHSTIQIHVEKANKDIRGLYPAILKELLENHFPDEKYVNREEDMGLENLRKSKQSLHPIKMVKKYCITLNDSYIVKANDDDFDEIQKLWMESFQDEDEISSDYYFQNLYRSENTYLLKNKERIISALQIVPFPIYKKETENLCYFILGVCTDKNFQNQGCMKKLLNYVLEQYIDKDIYLQAYVPEIYMPFGFQASHFHQRITVNKECLKDMGIMNPIDDLTLLESYYEAYTSQFEEYRIRNPHYWEMLIKRCEVFNQQILIFKDLGYLIYSQNEKSIYIHEFVYFNKEGAKQMLAYFYPSTQNLVLECDMLLNIDGEKETIMTMMSNCPSPINTRMKYINEIY